MRDYAELVKGLRYCFEHDDCGSRCPYFSSTTVCADERAKEAADAIEELQEKLIMAETDLSDFKDAMAWKEHFDILAEQDCQVPTWISVEERLPDYLDHVLCVNKFGIQMVGYLTDYKEGGFRCESGMDSCDYITHWMPLPKAPKEVRDA